MSFRWLDPMPVGPRCALFSAVALCVVLASEDADACTDAGIDYPVTSFGDDPLMPTDGVFVVVSGSWLAINGELTTSTGLSVNTERSWLMIDQKDDASTYATVFRPTEPLTTGTTYFAKWEQGSITVTLGTTTLGTTTLEGSKPPAPVTNATFQRVHALRGNDVSCTTGVFCSYTRFFRDTEVLVPAMTLSWSYAATPTSVYAITAVQPVPGKGELWNATVGSAHAGAAGGAGEKTVIFSNELPEYCVRLATLDLTDQTTVTSPDICVTATGSAGAAPDTTPLLEAELAACPDPPPGLLEEWCKLHPSSTSCPGEADAGTGGTSSTASGSSSNGSDGGSCAVGGAGRRDLGSWMILCLAFVVRRATRAYSAAP